MTVNPALFHIELLTCNTLRLNDFWNADNYSAPYWRLYWNPQKGAEIEWNGSISQLKPSHLFVIPPNTPYAARLLSPTDHLYIHFICHGPAPSFDIGIYPIPASGFIFDAVSELMENDLDTHRRVLLAMALANISLCKIPSAPDPNMHIPRRIRLVIETIDAHPFERISNDRLANEASMNTNAFIRLFKETMGTTPQIYITSKRVDMACVQLHFTEDTIDEIAFSLGFCDRYHFSRVFKKQRGIGPAAFRMQRMGE